MAFCSLRSLILANNFLPVNWALCFMETMSQLSKALVDTRDYFIAREFTEWVSLLNEAVELERSNDYSFVHVLWLKFGDTCEVDNLIITEYEPTTEDSINKLNSELTELVNTLFAALDRIVQNET